MTKKQKLWKKVISKTGVWLAAEIWLNLIGIDDIADYSEFIFAQDLDLNLKNRRSVKVEETLPQFCHQINDFCPIPQTIPKSAAHQEDSFPKKKIEVFKHKCQQLAKPCLKIIYLATNVEIDK